MNTTKRKSSNVVYNNNSVSYFRNGELHRDDGPAFIKFDPYTNEFVVRNWYQNGKRHRTDGPAIDGPNKVWYKDNIIHRDDGPAILYHNGMQIWYHCNRVHRLNGPAVVANAYTEYYIFGRKITSSQYKIFYKIISRVQSRVRSRFLLKIYNLLNDKFYTDIQNSIISYII